MNLWRPIRSGLIAARAYSFPASTVPVFVGAAYASTIRRLNSTEIAWFLYTWVAATLLHAGCNLINDYYDWKNRVDEDHDLRSSAVDGTSDSVMKSIRLGGLVCLGIGSFIGLDIAIERSWSVLLIGTIGVGIAYFYTARPLGLKYRALGELAVFLGMGPLMVFGTFIAIRQEWNKEVWLVSVPIGLMVTAILYANNLRDFRNDASKGFVTLPMILGEKLAPLFFYCLIAGAYVIPIVFAVMTRSWRWLLPLVSMPLALRSVRRIRRGFPDSLDLLLNIDVVCARLHLVYGILFIIGIN